jgi:solute carrier family 35 (UDP-xylose/UDP-N-acetylglucosamine transporter), member B4
VRSAFPEVSATLLILHQLPLVIQTHKFHHYKQRPAGMARKQKTDGGSSSQSNSMPGQSTSRRRATLRELHSSADGEGAIPKVINAAPSLEKAEMFGIDNERPTSSKIMALLGRMFMETIPQWLAIGAMLSLIFGGCCSNVS